MSDCFRAFWKYRLVRGVYQKPPSGARSADDEDARSGDHRHADERLQVGDFAEQQETPAHAEHQVGVIKGGDDRRRAALVGEGAADVADDHGGGDGAHSQPLGGTEGDPAAEQKAVRCSEFLGLPEQNHRAHDGAGDDEQKVLHQRQDFRAFVAAFGARQDHRHGEKNRREQRQQCVQIEVIGGRPHDHQHAAEPEAHRQPRLAAHAVAAEQRRKQRDEQRNRVQHRGRHRQRNMRQRGVVKKPHHHHQKTPEQGPARGHRHQRNPRRGPLDQRQHHRYRQRRAQHVNLPQGKIVADQFDDGVPQGQHQHRHDDGADRQTDVVIAGTGLGGGFSVQFFVISALAGA